MSSLSTRVRAAVAATLITGVAVGGVAPVAADPVGTGSASAFGATVVLAGTDLIPPTPAATVAAPSGDDSETLIDLPVSPVVVNGTLTATANVHAASDVESGLTVVDQDVEGPYNARGLAQIEGLGVLFDVAGAGIPLVSAAAVRSEAAAVCRNGSVSYTANSEIIDLDVAGTDLPLNGPVQDLIDAISDVLETTGLNAVVDVDRNVVTELPGGGIAVDALVVTLLAAAGDPLAVVRLAHAEVGPTSCAPPAADPAECADTIDNADPEDTLIDAADPGCHTDGNAGNPDSYDPNDDDETDVAGVLPRTGVDASWTVSLAGLAALLAVGVRRLVRSS